MSDLIRTETIDRLHRLADESGAHSVEQLVLMALQSLDSNLCDIEPDDETWAAIERAESQVDVPADEAERRIFTRTRGKMLTP